MRDPSKDNPTESAIQHLIVERRFREAYDQAYLAYRDEIVDYCTKRLRRLRGYGSDESADAEEIVQEVFLAFWRSLPRTYDPSRAKVRTLLFHIANKRFIDKRRTPNKSIPGRDVELHELDFSDVITSYSMNPETILLEKERQEILHRRISKLSIRLKEVMNLFLFGYSTAEIAKATGAKAGAVRTRISRAYDKLELSDIDNPISIRLFYLFLSRLKKSSVNMSSHLFYNRNSSLSHSTLAVFLETTEREKAAA